MENIYENLALIKTKLMEFLMQNKEVAFLSKDLSRIQKDAPIDFNLEQCRWGSYDKEEVKKILEQFEFYSLISRSL